MLETMEKMDGQMVLDRLLSSDRSVADKIYQECYPSVRFMITSNSGNIFDAEDIFHDAMALVIEKARKNKLELTCSLKTYLYSVSFNLWQKQLNRKAREVSFSEDIDYSDEFEQDQKINYERMYDIFRNNFEMLNPEYQKILNMYLSKCSMREITSEMGYANEKYAKVKKYMCKEHLKKNIINDPRFKEFILLSSN